MARTTAAPKQPPAPDESTVDVVEWATEDDPVVRERAKEAVRKLLASMGLL